MIWVSTYFVACAKVSTLQPIIRFEILLQLLHWKVELMYRERFLIFSPTTYEDE